jgi:hypothetical protein
VTAGTAAPPLIGFWGTFDLGRGIFATVYLAVCLLWFIVIQTKLVCTNCAYYDKVCARGLGKLAPLLYRQGTGLDVWGGRLGRVFWPYWYAGVPLLGFALLLIFRFSWATLIFAAVFVVAAALSLIINRTQCCTNCLVRNLCLRSPFRDKTLR